MKTTFEQFRDSHEFMTALEFEAADDRPVDLGSYGNDRRMSATIHRYEVRSEADDVTRLYIIEMIDGFHWTFMHPQDDIAPSLSTAERALFEDFIANYA